MSDTNSPCMRFTPTRVGTTHNPLQARHWPPVHPHACGDNSLLAILSTQYGGSPPRVWGQRSFFFLPEPSRRFTPTRVGTTIRFFQSGWAVPVHPHACGDNCPTSLAASAKDGSPPRVWGQPGQVLGHFRRFRFTPTRVGTTMLAVPSLEVASVHPHACGDNMGIALPPFEPIGSPPRVWGQRMKARNVAPFWRFTPTRVGTTKITAGLRATAPVHPHACGDNFAGFSTFVSGCGSPPRVWGQLPCR